MRTIADVVLEKLQKSTERVHSDLKYAYMARHVLSEANSLIIDHKAEYVRQVNIMRIIQRSLVIDMALCVSRIFDEPTKRFSYERSDKRSLPVAMWFLQDEGLRSEITALFPAARSARMEAAATAAIKQFVAFKNSTVAQHALSALKATRDRDLAHPIDLESTERVRPTYNQIDILIDIATSINRQLVIFSDDADTDHTYPGIVEAAKSFWSEAFAGLTEGSKALEGAETA